MANSWSRARVARRRDADARCVRLSLCLVAMAAVQVIEHHLRGRDYSEAMLPQWINDIAESCMEELHAPKKPFKYIGQRGGRAKRAAVAPAAPPHCRHSRMATGQQRRTSSHVLSLFSLLRVVVAPSRLSVGVHHAAHGRGHPLRQGVLLGHGQRWSERGRRAQQQPRWRDSGERMATGGTKRRRKREGEIRRVTRALADFGSLLLCARLLSLSLGDRVVAATTSQGSQQPHHGLYRHGVRSVILSVGHLSDCSLSAAGLPTVPLLLHCSHTLLPHRIVLIHPSLFQTRVISIRCIHRPASIPINTLGAIFLRQRKRARSVSKNHEISTCAQLD